MVELIIFFMMGAVFGFFLAVILASSRYENNIGMTVEEMFDSLDFNNDSKTKNDKI